MDIVLGLLAIVTGVGVPIYLQRRDHPRQELRYAVTVRTGAPTGEGFSRQIAPVYRLRLWSTSRADISSRTFDDGRALVFHVSGPLEVLRHEPGPLHAESVLCLLNPQQIVLTPQLLHADFDSHIDFVSQHPFILTVVSPLIDVRIVRDLRVEFAGLAREQRAVIRTRKKAHLSLFTISLSLSVLGFLLLVVGVSLSYADEALGAQFGIPSVLILPVALPLLIVSGIRRLASSIRESRGPRAN